LLQVVPHIMFGNEMTRQRVEAASQEAGHDEIDEYAFPTRYKGRKEKIECQLGGDTNQVPVGWFLRADKPRTKGIKEYLKRAITCRVVG